MNTKNEHFVIKPLSLAVQGAWLAMLAMPLVVVAAETTNAEAEALKHPVNFVEIGAMNVGQDSGKFGEYNGLDESGGYAVGNFSVRGGNGYDGGDGTTRWELKGSDLGTTSRAASAKAGNQGQWNIGISYDELRHRSTDNYQTPFQGGMGGNNFVLPETFGVIDVTSAGMGTQELTANQLASFHTQDVYSDRKNTSVNAGYNIDLRWNVQFDYNHLDQSGAKLIGVSFAPDPVGGGAGETIAKLMNPTNYQTDTYNLALNWVGDNSHLTASYVASIFRDGYQSVSWSNPFVDTSPGASTTGTPPGAAFPVNVFATAPSNDFHQLNLFGGYDLTPTTKLAGGLSYGRNTQDSSFINDPLMTAALPRTSLNGLVVTTHADLKLTNQTTKDLVLSAGVKYNERDNRTPSSIYGPFNTVAGDPMSTVVNTPLSTRKTQLELTGDYQFDKKQSARLAYEYEKVQRWCNNDLANTYQSTDVPAGYYTNSACVQSPESNEHKLSANYKLKASKGVSLNVGYAISRRIADYNNSFYNPMQTSAEGLQNLGYRAYFDASRTEQLVKAGINWKVNGKLSVGLNGRYVDDSYDATLGVQQGHTWGLNLDSAYSYSQDGTVSAYLSVQRRQRDLLASAQNSPLAPPTDLWSNKLNDDTYTVGIAGKQQGLMGGKLVLDGDLSYTQGKTGYSTQMLNYTSPDYTCATACGDLPDIKNTSLRLKLGGTYQVDKASKIALGYLFNRRRSNDYYYSAYQTGSTDVTVLPNNQSAPNYTVNVFTVSYIYSF